MAYWITEQYPFVIEERKDNPGIWVRPRKESAANNLKLKDFVFIYETYKDKDRGNTGGHSAIIALVQVTKRVHIKEGHFIRIANAKFISEGCCPYNDVLKILNCKSLRSLGPLNSKLKEISLEQYRNFKRYFDQSEKTAEEEAALAYESSPRSDGQGFSIKEKNKVIEQYAMQEAKKHLRGNKFIIEDHSSRKPYDLFCKKANKAYFCEVKGTQSLGNEIILTKNEVGLAQNKKNMILCVVHSIQIDNKSNKLKASAGKIKLINPWNIDSARLSPLLYKYNI